MLHDNQALDSSLGLCGVYLAHSASTSFHHANVKNVASGTLDSHATVTNAEMVEHVFYQVINLVQIVFLHTASISTDVWERLFLALLATSPWLFRDRFPVNTFSANYERNDPRSSSFIRLLYRVKKYQYVFYKHFLLHGLNISIALSGVDLVSDRLFRVYWLLLNTSYVMEFFLQTLVKKGYMMQEQLLQLQRILMLSSSIAAIHVLQHVHWIVASASLLLNFIHRKHEVFNFFVIMIGSICYLL